MLIDTSTQSIGKHAQSVFENLNQDYIRIQLSELEQSRIDWSSYVNDGPVRLHSKKELRDHQTKALQAVKDGLAERRRYEIIVPYKKTRVTLVKGVESQEKSEFINACYVNSPVAK